MAREIKICDANPPIGGSGVGIRCQNNQCDRPGTMRPEDMAVKVTREEDGRITATYWLCSWACFQSIALFRWTDFFPRR